MRILVSTLLWLLVHGPSGNEILVNVGDISSLRQLDAAQSTHFHSRAHCVLTLTNGKFIAIQEACRDVRKKIAELNK